MKLSKCQVAGFVKTIIVAAIDRIESGTLTAGVGYVDRDGNMDDWETSAMETAGMALSILYAQITSDGMGVGDAIHVAGLDDALQAFVEEAWGDQDEIERRIKAKSGENYHLTDIYEKYPDADALTEKFMTVFEDEVFNSLEFSENWVPPTLQSDAQEIKVKSDDLKFLADLMDWLNEYKIKKPENTTIFLNC